MRFARQVVLVAGGTGGLGHAVSLAFLNEGAEVVVTYRKDQEFAELQARARSGVALLAGHRLDVTDENAVRQLIEGITAGGRTLDVLVNTVGGYAGGIPLWQTSTTVFELMVSLNLRAGFCLLREGAQVMLQAGKGVMINVASRAALDHQAGAAAYAASKAAALAMMDSLAADRRGTHMRANSVLPSIIDTEANQKAMPGSDFRQWPKPDDIARVILFLASDEAKLIHGAALPVYGNG
jgi:NAD(P)-dependent dehydrogenase (short-subunit alcohol dehydrogenase family)